MNYIFVEYSTVPLLSCFCCYTTQNLTRIHVPLIILLDVVFQFFGRFKFHYPLFWGMVMFVGDAVAQWLGCWTPDGEVWVPALEPSHCVVFLGKILYYCHSASLHPGV